MFTLKVRIDMALLETLTPHAARAVAEGLLSEEEALNAIIDEIAERGVKVEMDPPFEAPRLRPKPAPTTRRRRRRQE